MNDWNRDLMINRVIIPELITILTTPVLREKERKKSGRLQIHE